MPWCCARPAQPWPASPPPGPAAATPLQERDRASSVSDAAAALRMKRTELAGKRGELDSLLAAKRAPLLQLLNTTVLPEPVQVRPRVACGCICAARPTPEGSRRCMTGLVQTHAPWAATGGRACWLLITSHLMLPRLPDQSQGGAGPGQAARRAGCKAHARAAAGGPQARNPVSCGRAGREAGLREAAARMWACRGAPQRGLLSCSLAAHGTQ